MIFQAAQILTACRFVYVNKESYFQLFAHVLYITNRRVICRNFTDIYFGEKNKY